MNSLENKLSSECTCNDESPDTMCDYCYREAIQGQVEEAKRIISVIEEIPEVKCFNENGSIPCKANCARYYEQLCWLLKDLRIALNGNNPIMEEKK